MSAGVSIDRVKAVVAAEFGLSQRDLVSQRRHKDLAQARQVAMYLACTRTPHSTPAIGRAFGNRDHTTVLHALKIVAARRGSDRELDRRIRELEQGLVPPIPLAQEIQLAFLDGPLFDWKQDPARPQPTLTRIAA